MSAEPVQAKAEVPLGRLQPNPKGRLRDQFHEVARFRHLAVRTEGSYWDWVVRYLKFHRDRAGAWQHPKDLGSRGVTPFLTWLATERDISASTQNQALNALLFLYREVLQLPFVAQDFVRARRTRGVPTVIDAGRSTGAVGGDGGNAQTDGAIAVWDGITVDGMVAAAGARRGFWARINHRSGRKRGKRPSHNVA
jgi:hypothetical protein